MTSRCTGACGLRSRNATTCSSRWTSCAGISPRAILQKMQSGSVVLIVSASSALPGPDREGPLSDLAVSGGVVHRDAHGNRAVLQRDARDVGDELVGSG